MEPIATARASRPKVRRLSTEPIVAPGAAPGYGAIFNAGVIHHDGVYHLFARGVREGYRRNTGEGPRFEDYISDILVFVSDDGLDYTFQQVLARGSPDGVFCYEDPRVQLIHSDGVEHVIMTYTNLPGTAAPDSWRIGIHKLIFEQGRFSLEAHPARIVGPSGHANKDAVICNLSNGHLAFIHRIHPNIQLAIFERLDDLLSADADYWDNHLEDLDRHTILQVSPESLGIGAGAPPVLTEAGLLLFFHERTGSGVYTMNVALLSHDTGRVIAMLDHPVLHPELPWETDGDVEMVVFVSGAHRHEDGTIYLTYGAADRAVGAGSIHETELLSALAAA